MEVLPQRPTTKGPSEFFAGEVWLDVIGHGHGHSPITFALVHFTPGARTAWHSHSLGQTLHVTEGEARVQSRGEPVVTVGPGQTVFTPGGEWHWHGAAPDRLMTHLSISEGEPEWGDHVSEPE
ncbi:MAG TPA: cupin domain-containing protein [Acidimicrobiales bacterium]|nr:cupin domain-containing protein [Acidimicrobiales bacterium]